MKGSALFPTRPHPNVCIHYQVIMTFKVFHVKHFESDSYVGMLKNW